MKFSLEQLKTSVKNIITTAKLSNENFVVTRENIVGLLDKVGKIGTLDSVYTIDKLARFDGEYLSYGKTIEEWQMDLTMPVDYKPNGETALAPHYPTFRPAFYSYTIGRQYIPTSVANNNIERAVHNEGEFISVVAMTFKRLEDSLAQYRYALKREMIAKLYDLCNINLSSLSVFDETLNYNVNDLVKNDTSAYIVVKKYTGGSVDDIDGAIADGYLIKLDLVTKIAKPTDTATGEAFLKQVKKDIEVASDVSEGHSLNGNTLGVTDTLVLLVKQGVMPSIDVDTLAGAFHLDKVAIPVEVIVVKDFGGADEPYAVLLDSRGLRLHPTYNATRENFNGEGDFLNLFRHTENTAFISRNTFVKFYTEPE